MISALAIRKEEVEGISMELNETLEDVALTGRQRDRLDGFIDNLKRLAVTPISEEE